jgi:hypothetical protein
VRQQVRGRYAVRDARDGDLLFRADQAFGHGGLAGQEGSCHLGHRQPTQGPQSERDLGFQRDGRVAAGEDEAQPLVGDAAVVGFQRRRHQVGQLGRGDPVVPDHVDGVVARGRGQPGLRTAGYAVAPPRRQRFGERVLGRILGEIPVAGDRDEIGDDPAPIGPECVRQRSISGRAEGAVHDSRTGRISTCPMAVAG